MPYGKQIHHEKRTKDKSIPMKNSTGYCKITRALKNGFQ